MKFIRIQYLPLMIVLSLVVLMKVEPSGAAVVQQDFLWLEYQDAIKEKDGSMTLPLQIHYGTFPQEEKKFPDFLSLRAFYVSPVKEETAQGLIYESAITPKTEGLFLNINSLKSRPFTVFVEAKISQNGTPHTYLAKTSFVLFGSVLKEEVPRYSPVSGYPVDRSLEITTRPPFHYWPQTGQPVDIIPLWHDQRLQQDTVHIFDEHQALESATTSREGVLTYLPPDDAALNARGDTAFKQTVFVVQKDGDGGRYISTCTMLLHRNRFNKHNTVMGIFIFGAAMLGCLGVVLGRRRRFRFESF